MKETKYFMRQAGLLLICLLISGAAVPKTDTLVRNYDECVKAGHPTFRHGGQERCWTAREFRPFVKGLKPTIRQGVYGTITLRTGNCMPRSVDTDKDGKIIVPRDPDPCRSAVIDRVVFVYKLYKWPDLPADSAPVKFTRSQDGFYELELPEGTYSLLVEDNGRKHCGWADGNLYACPITIKAGEILEQQIEINHASS